MTKLSKLKVAIALVAGVSASAAIAAPKAVDVSHGRTGVGQNITFVGIDKINRNSNVAANANAKVRLLASCVQSALGCASVTPPGGGGGDTGGNDGGTAGGVGDTGGNGGGTAGSGGDTGGNGGGTAGGVGDTGSNGGEVVTGPTGPVIETPSFSGIVADDANSNNDVAAACVQDESFCKDANLKRVANRNSVIDEIFFYTEL